MNIIVKLMAAVVLVLVQVMASVHIWRLRGVRQGPGKEDGMNTILGLLMAAVSLPAELIAVLHRRYRLALAGWQMVAVSDHLLDDMGLSRPAIVSGFPRVQATERGSPSR